MYIIAFVFEITPPPEDPAASIDNPSALFLLDLVKPTLDLMGGNLKGQFL